MLFDEFCECRGDLSSDTEIEMKKYIKRSILEQRKTKGEIQIVDRSRHISRPIGKSFKEEKQKGRELADRSHKTSRSIGPTMRVTQKKRRSIVACEPIDQEPNESETVSAPIDHGLSADRSAEARHALRRHFPSI